MNNLDISLIDNDTDIKYICDNLSTTFTCTWNCEQFVQAINTKDTHCYISKIDNKLVGFICIQVISNQIDILNIAVDISYRKLGIGYILVNKIIELAKQDNLFPIMLEVNTNNTFAIKLYEKVGFRIIHTRKGYYFNKLTNNKEDAYVMNFKEEYIC